MQNNTYIFNYKDDIYVFDSNKLIFFIADISLVNALKDVISGKRNIIPSNSYLDMMIDAGYFITNNEEKTQQYQMENHDMLNISFAPIHACNFRCEYCYAEGGTATENFKKKFDRFEIDKLIDYIYFKRFSSFKKYKFDFVSGGEPLLAMDILEYFLSSVRKIDSTLGKQTTVFVATNGSLLTDSIIKRLDQLDVYLGISLDGPKDIHNRHRHYINGYDTYDDVVESINRLHNSKVSSKLKDAWALCVVTNQTDDLVSVMEQAINLGFKGLQMQIVRVPKGHKLEFNENNLPVLFERYNNLFEHIKNSVKLGDLSRIKMIANNNDSFGKYLKRLLLREPVYSRCFAGKNKVAITADGKVFACDSFCNLENFMLENIDMTRVCSDNCELFQNAYTCNSEVCRKCWARNICGGDCYYHSYDINRDIHIPDPIMCKISQYFIEQAIVLLLFIYQQSPEYIEYLTRFLSKR